MSAREKLREMLLRSEVDQVERGSDHILSMRSRRAAREAELRALRASAGERHESLRDAVRRRFGLLTR